MRFPCFSIGKLVGSLDFERKSMGEEQCEGFLGNILGFL